MRLYRERDALDYLLLVAVLGLGYLHLPWRSQVRAAVADAVATLLAASGEAGLGVPLFVGLLVGVGFLYYLTAVVPRRG